MQTARYRKLDEAVRHLKVGDLVMVNADTVLGSVVRRTTGSHWSHVAIVFDVPDVSSTEHDVLIVEAAWQVEIHRLTAYTHEPETYEIGFKRLDFLTDAERERFRGFFLDAVDTPYDTHRLWSFVVESAIAWTKGVNVNYNEARKYIDTKNFICTSLAQRAFYLAVSPEKRGRTLFRGQEKGLDFLRLMEDISPGHIARSENTSWLYNPHR
jgi:hypothetical protein